MRYCLECGRIGGLHRLGCGSRPSGKSMNAQIHPLEDRADLLAKAHHQMRAKRFTDAELAAEYWAQDSKCRHEQWIETVRGDDDYEDWERAGQSRMYDQLTALHRFATLPSYDERSAS